MLSSLVLGSSDRPYPTIKTNDSVKPTSAVNNKQVDEGFESILIEFFF